MITQLTGGENQAYDDLPIPGRWSLCGDDHAIFTKHNPPGEFGQTTCSTAEWLAGRHSGGEHEETGLHILASADSERSGRKPTTWIRQRTWYFERTKISSPTVSEGLARWSSCR